MSQDFDVVVVGAGAAGAWAAARMAQAGRSVALVERQALDHAGARWVNGVAPWMLGHAGVPAPMPPETRGQAAAFIMTTLHGGGRVAMRPAPVHHIDMRLLTQRLQGAAREAGAQVFERTRADHLALAAGRPHTLQVSGPGGVQQLRARLFVDAAGLGGALRDQVPALAPWCPRLGRQDICSAAQQVHGVRDRAGAERWLADHDILPGDTVGFVSAAGGFSTLTVQVSPDLSHVEVLTGTIPGGGVPDGPSLLRRFVAEQPWVGEREFGGAGAIPLRRAWDRLGVPGLALVGDAACQVFPGHGSGVGPGLVAAHHLAEAVGHHDDPGCLEAVWRYQAAYHRDVGAVCAAYDVFRRLTQTLQGADSAAVFAAGLMTETMAASGLRQRMPLPRPDELVQTLAGALKAPRLAARLAPAAARMQVVHQLYRRHPLTPHEPALRQWSARVGLAFGEVGLAQVARAIRG